MQYASGKVNEKISLYLDPKHYQNSASPEILSQGLYAKHLSRYLQYFDKCQIKVLLLEDMIGDHAEFFNSVWEFLEVEPVILDAIGIKSNVRKRRQTRVNKALINAMKNYGVGKILKIRIVKSVTDRVIGMLPTKKIIYPPLSKKLILDMRDYYESDILKLEKLLDRDLSNWLALSEQY